MTSPLKPSIHRGLAQTLRSYAASPVISLDLAHTLDEAAAHLERSVPASQLRALVEEVENTVLDLWAYDPGEWAAGEYREAAMREGLAGFRARAIAAKRALDALLARLEEGA